MKEVTLDYKTIRRDLKRNAKALGIPAGAADSFIDRIVPAIEKSLKGRSIITESDLNRIIAKEARKYNKDFAYVYQNRDKII